MSMKLIPNAKKEILQSAADAWIGAAVERDDEGSNSALVPNPALPGLQIHLKNLTQTVCWSSLKQRKKSCARHCGACPLEAEKRHSFPLLILNDPKHFSKSTTQ
jgi:hypothetical protein